MMMSGMVYMPVPVMMHIPIVVGQQEGSQHDQQQQQQNIQQQIQQIHQQQPPVIMLDQYQWMQQQFDQNGCTPMQQPQQQENQSQESLGQQQMSMPMPMAMQTNPQNQHPQFPQGTWFTPQPQMQMQQPQMMTMMNGGQQQVVMMPSMMNPQPQSQMVTTLSGVAQRSSQEANSSSDSGHSDSMEVPSTPTSCGSPRDYNDYNFVTEPLPFQAGTITYAQSLPEKDNKYLKESVKLLTLEGPGRTKGQHMSTNLAANATQDLELIIPDIGVMLSGVQNVNDHFMSFFESVPDLFVRVHEVSEESGDTGSLFYEMKGTANKASSPFWPVGQEVAWCVHSRHELDEFRKIKSVELRFEMPIVKVPRGNLHALSTNASFLAKTDSGCRLLQNALELEQITEEDKANLVNNIKDMVWDLSLSPHGNHVLQKFVVCLSPDQVQFIVDALKGRVGEAAQHQMQSRVLQRILEHCPTSQTEELIDEIVARGSRLMRHAFGNFVVQAVLEHGLPSHKSLIAAMICEDVSRLARHRIASNVVRRALVNTLGDDRDALIKALMADPQGVSSLAKHKVGSFVARELRVVSRKVASEAGTAAPGSQDGEDQDEEGGEQDEQENGEASP